MINETGVEGGNFVSKSPARPPNSPIVEEEKQLQMGNNDQAREIAKPANPEAGKLTLLQAVSMNIMNMFGTGPLITIPYCVASVDPMGPHCIWGYGVACIACLCDSLVWGEIGSMWPESGGAYVYLRELYGNKTWGRLISFMFVWQFFISGPAEAASGFIAIAEYLTYFSEDTVSYGYRVLISMILIAVCTILLARKLTDIGLVGSILTFITVCAMIYTIIAGFSYWDAGNLVTPDDAFKSNYNGLWIIALASRFGVYDMTGYYDVCFMGGEVQNPKRNIPLSCVATCGCIAIIYLLVYVAVLGSMPWQDNIEMFTDDYDGVPFGIMSIFTEWRTGSKPFAMFITIIVAITIFGSAFAMLVGFVFIPPAAARDGYFYSFFAPKANEKGEGLPVVSLVFIITLTVIFSFFSMSFVVDAMTTMIVLVMFCGQSLGLVIYRYRTPVEDQPEGWRMPLFPLPCIIQFIIFFFIFLTTDNSSWDGADPILETSVGFLGLGVVMFLLRSKYNKQWPFECPLEASSAAMEDGQLGALDLNVDCSPIAKLATSPTAYISEMEAVKIQNTTVLVEEPTQVAPPAGGPAAAEAKPAAVLSPVVAPVAPQDQAEDTQV